jgi:paraquat-inducible protein B
MSKQASRSLIGAFVIGAIALAVAGVVIFGSGKFFAKTDKAVLFFEGSIKGLDVGAPVEFRGVKVGHVTEIKLRFDAVDLSIVIPVIIELDRNDVILVRGKWGPGTEQLEGIVKKGLKAQLVLQSFVTGKLLVNLDVLPDKPARIFGQDMGYPEIPTVPSSYEALSRGLENINIEQIALDLRRTAESIERFVSSPELKETIGSLNQALKSLDKLARDIDTNTSPAAAETLDQIASLARSLRNLTDYLERHPESLIRGKKPSKGE